MAYLLSGYSVHAGVRWQLWRLDLGAFAARYPEFLAKHSELEGRAHGAGLKLDYRFAQSFERSESWLEELSRGAFVGLDTRYAWLTVRHPASEASKSDFQVGVSLRAGWDIPIASGFYVTPWASFGPVFGVEPLVVEGRRWEPDRWEGFATLHVGFRPEQILGVGKTRATGE